MITPERLAPFYSRFLAHDRILLTGHSHQAWPDCGFHAQQEAWLDAADYVDEKWDRAFARAARVRREFAKLLSDDAGDYALAASTHELVVRFLSALPLHRRPRIITTDAEFHSVRRQLDRLGEEGLDIIKVGQMPAASLPERLMAEIDDRTAAVIVSLVFFTNAQIVTGLGSVAGRCNQFGAELLVDVYHALNVLPVSLGAEGLRDAFVVGGGYKYCQLGEGNCFLRVPRDCTLRPVVTGWFSEFGALTGGQEGPTRYGSGADRFAGATYDPTSHYRATRVFEFFEEQKLAPPLLRHLSQHQVRLLAQSFDELDADPRLITRDRTVPLERIAGFLTLHSPRAGELCRAMRTRNVWTDYRGDALRLGPAPYVSDGQLAQGLAALGEAIAEMSAGNLPSGS